MRFITNVLQTVEWDNMNIEKYTDEKVIDDGGGGAVEEWFKALIWSENLSVKWQSVQRL